MAEAESSPKREDKKLIGRNLPVKRAHFKIDEEVVTGVLANEVTPAKSSAHHGDTATAAVEKLDAQRALFRSSTSEGPAAVTPARAFPQHAKPDSPARQKLLFGRLVNQVVVADNVRRVYSIVRKLTGSIGGNGSSGPIYGELTMGSMQKVVNAMVEYTEFGASSRFIDVGSGIGKPNLHVAQDPGVEFSYGLEIEKDRWLLGMTCLGAVLEAASEKQPVEAPVTAIIHHRCIFECDDISHAQSFDPFTHVYMFSCGFPPALWMHLSHIWNKSSSPYMICYSGPKHMIVDYEFHLELIKQLPTSMHGSKEGHMAYIYRRRSSSMSPITVHERTTPCDPLFQAAWDRVRGDSLVSLSAFVQETLTKVMRTDSGPATRARRRAC